MNDTDTKTLNILYRLHLVNALSAPQFHTIVWSHQIFFICYAISGWIQRNAKKKLSFTKSSSHEFSNIYDIIDNITECTVNPFSVFLFFISVLHQIVFSILLEKRIFFFQSHDQSKNDKTRVKSLIV